ncbi:unnamed protein product [Adineta steineri]|uniref:Uncharacterized protein n=1 Tax=Adineta steineri TaxID=433720 RepID=A0A819MM28_9BILA|nr:unnamed protein product [Adineta steineri]
MTSYETYNDRHSFKVILPRRSTVKFLTNQLSISSVNDQLHRRESTSTLFSSQVRPSIITEEKSSDDDSLDGDISSRQNNRFCSQLSRKRRRISVYSLTLQKPSSSSS